MDPEEKPRELPARRGFSLSYKGKTLLSRVDPVGQAERIIESLAVKDRTLYFCPSPIYGYGLSLLLEKLPPGSAVLSVEADPGLFSLTEQALTDLAAKSKGRLVLAKIKKVPDTPALTGSIAQDLCGLVHKTWGKRSFRRVETLRLTGGRQLFPELYDTMAAVLEKDIALAWGNAMTLIRLGRLYIRNAVRNLPLLPVLGDLSTLNFGGAPLLVLGAGPSMDLILDELARNRGVAEPEERRFRILCADTCLPALKARGIKPDLVVILESQHWNLRDFINCRDWGVPAALDLSALPSSARVLGGETWFFMTPWTEMAFLRRLEKTGLLKLILTPLGSVGLSAVELGLALGSGPVVTGGLDFSFTLDAYHARSTPGHLGRLASACRFTSPLNAGAAFREGTFVTLSKSGLPVRSDPALRNYQNLFKNEFSLSERLYEIRGPGLSLGTTELDPAEAVKLLMGGKEKHETQQKVPGRLDVQQKKAALIQFIMKEKELLLKLRSILTGEAAASPEEKETLLDTADYLWAHFPECAAAGGRRPDAKDLSFLKRVRAEIDPFIKLWDASLREISGP